MRLTVKSTAEGLHLTAEISEGQTLEFDVVIKGLTFTTNQVIMDTNLDGTITMKMPFEEGTPA